MSALLFLKSTIKRGGGHFRAETWDFSSSPWVGQRGGLGGGVARGIHVRVRGKSIARNFRVLDGKQSVQLGGGKRVAEGDGKLDLCLKVWAGRGKHPKRAHGGLV